MNIDRCYGMFQISARAMVKKSNIITTNCLIKNNAKKGKGTIILHHILVFVVEILWYMCFNKLCCSIGHNISVF
jgi:hypothetical protein